MCSRKYRAAKKNEQLVILSVDSPPYSSLLPVVLPVTSSPVLSEPTEDKLSHYHNNILLQVNSMSRYVNSMGNENINNFFLEKYLLTISAIG